MSVYAPDYYPEFHCIADQCRHTCCAGWEIDIDPESYARYTSAPMARDLEGKIGDGHFLLSDGDRCPMLREDGLCNMILKWGESSLCQICTDHPRFRNFWTGRTEIGLGMVCEEAARIILGSPHPLRLIRIEGDASEPLPPKERTLMAARDRLLASVRLQGPKARLMEYLIYRHIADSLYDGRFSQRVSFVRDSWLEITRGWNGDPATLIERCRVFSDTVEYDSDELEKRISRYTISKDSTL